MSSLWERWTLGVQSVFENAGVNAALINDLALLLTVVLGVSFLITMAALFVAWFARGSGRWIIWLGGVTFPIVVLIAIAVVTTGVTRALARLAGPDPLIVEVEGYQFWWDIVYPDDGEAPWARTANEVHLPAGRPVTFRLMTKDVIHSFWMPALGGKLDMIPGRINELTVIAEEPGLYRGQCAEFCGEQHARMGFDVVVHAPEDFRRWRADLADEADDPATPIERQGQEVFLANGCTACHAVRGLAGEARVGPDLTNVGARATIGAGMWPTNVGNLAGWTANVQTLKPGANMPSYTMLSGPDLRALAAYLYGLE